MLLLSTTFILITVFSICGFGIKAKAQSTLAAEAVSYKYYKSVMVTSGDTLWDYAKTYADEAFYDSYNSYIKEVISINSLEDEIITSGQYIILPYYSNEFQ